MTSSQRHKCKGKHKTGCAEDRAHTNDLELWALLHRKPSTSYMRTSGKRVNHQHLGTQYLWITLVTRDLANPGHEVIYYFAAIAFESHEFVRLAF